MDEAINKYLIQSAAMGVSIYIFRLDHLKSAQIIGIYCHSRPPPWRKAFCPSSRTTPFCRLSLLLPLPSLESSETLLSQSSVSTGNYLCVTLKNESVGLFPLLTMRRLKLINTGSLKNWLALLTTINFEFIIILSLLSSANKATGGAMGSGHSGNRDNCLVATTSGAIY
eukprot:scaffold107408_cov16-Prasinocladus_malaysianus.AAC.3